MKKALISGITGQDGSFLAEFLLQKGYEVHGILRRSSSFNTGRIEHLYFDEWVRDMKQKRTINLHYGDMTDSSSLIRIIQSVQPDEIYNLAAQSHVKVSFDVPEYTAETDAVGTLRMLEAVRILGMEKKTRIYQASTSELFGKVQEVPQSETTPFYPRSPYGVAKQYGFWITKNYRESYGMFAVNGILFNHESERRGETFVTRKITLAAARIAQGFQDKLYLGNLDARRDWGYAKDYIECMWLILQHDTPEDFVIATGEMHTVREFATLAFPAQSDAYLPECQCRKFAYGMHFSGGNDEVFGGVVLQDELGRPGSGREGYRHTDRKSPRGSRPQIFPACRSGTIAGRPHQSKNTAGMESEADQF